MNEKNKIYVVLGVLAAIILFIILIVAASGKKNEEVYNAFEEAFTKEENTLVYIGRPTCSYCSLFEPNLIDMSERYDFDYIYINTDDIGSTYLNKIIDKLGLSQIGTPYIAVVNKDGIIDTQSGYTDYDDFFGFLKKNKFIDSDAELLINFIGKDEYKNLISSSSPQVIVIGQSTCGYCTSAKLALMDIAKEYNVELNYLNLSYLSEDEYKEILNSFEYLSSGDWGTPLLLLVKDGKLVARENGFAGKEAYISFLQEQGVI